MFHSLKKIFRRRVRYKNQDIAPDEIFLDSKNLPDFNVHQFEGRIEKPISAKVFHTLTVFMCLLGCVFLYRLWGLQIVGGQVFKARSDNNSLDHTIIFADRGMIFDKNRNPLAWNVISSDLSDFSLRVYATSTGLSTILGYIKYPAKDSKGIYYAETFEAKDGLEKIYNEKLTGKNGTKIIETDVSKKIISESVIEKPKSGGDVVLSIDLRLQRRLSESLLEIAERAGYKGGAGAVMDIRTGELLAISNFPEYDSQVMTDGLEDGKISGWINSKNHPFLNRAVSGLYTPGSIMKPFIAMGVLGEGVIDPRKQIISTGSITVPNPFFPDKPSIFLDWKAHGAVDLRKALAVSSNVYFYEVTGGFERQKGIGILNIEKYVKMFGFGSTTGVNFPGEVDGTIPNPTWKAENFDGEEWRVGDTYNSAIGQYGFQVSLMQVLRAVSALASGGTLVTPTFIKTDRPNISGQVSLNPNFYNIVKEGMRLGVTEGTSQAINFPFVQVASKTGTAQLGISKDEINSWVIGFWPYENPKYAYAVVMERGSRNNQFGAVLVMTQFLDWVHIYIPDYLE